MSYLPNTLTLDHAQGGRCINIELDLCMFSPKSSSIAMTPRDSAAALTIAKSFDSALLSAINDCVLEYDLMR